MAEHHSSTAAASTMAGQHGANGTSGSGTCSGEQHPQDTILFIFFGLALGVLTKKFIDAFSIPVPYTVCLLLLGLAWAGLTTLGLGLLGDSACLLSVLDPELLLIIFLPMLIFESAFSLEWHAFRNAVFPALILAIPGLIFSIFITGIIINYIILPDFDWNSSFLLGTILSATDPVAVVALLKELGGPHALATIIESESLLNDGTAIVAFAIFRELASGVHLTAGEGVEMAFQLSLGGPALGLIWGIVTIFFIGRIIDDDLAEVTMTLLSAYLLFYVAEDVVHVSGVLALVTMGACFAAYGKTRISPHSEGSTHTFWRILTYHGNTLIFLFVGIVLVLTNDFERIEGRDWGFVIVLWVFLYLIRGLMIAIFAYPLRWAGYPLTKKDAVIIVHGGLRGAVSLALALIVSLEEPEHEGEELPQITREKTLFYAGGIAFLTLIINASTTGPILRRLGMVKEAAAQKAVYEDARATIYRITLRRAKDMSKDKLFSMANWDEATQFVAPPTTLGKVQFHRHKEPGTPRPSLISMLAEEAERQKKEHDSEEFELPETKKRRGTLPMPEEGMISRSVLSPAPGKDEEQHQQRQQRDISRRQLEGRSSLVPPGKSASETSSGGSSTMQSHDNIPRSVLHEDDNNDDHEDVQRQNEHTESRMSHFFASAAGRFRRAAGRSRRRSNRDVTTTTTTSSSSARHSGSGRTSVDTSGSTTPRAQNIEDSSDDAVRAGRELDAGEPDQRAGAGHVQLEEPHRRDGLSKRVSSALLGRLGLRVGSPDHMLGHEYCLRRITSDPEVIEGETEPGPRREPKDGSSGSRTSSESSSGRARRRRRPSTSRSADMQNARLRFLVSTRAIYWELFESGFLDRDSVLLLVNASETEEEAVEHDSTRRLQDWNDTLKHVVRPPLVLRFLRSRKWVVLDALRSSLVRWLEIAHASHVVNIADAFTAAHRKVLGDLSGLLSEVAHSPENIRKLVQESFANVEQSKGVVREFPLEVVSIVRTRQAASLLLSHQEEAITNKFRHGVFTALEHEHLISHIRQVRSQLVLHTVSFHFPTEEGILRWSRLMEDLSVEDLKLCFDHMKIVNRFEGEDVVKHGQPCDGMYVILRGYAYFHFPSSGTGSKNHARTATTHGSGQAPATKRKHIDYLMAGRTMGIIETVAEHPGLVTIRVRSKKVQLAYFSLQAVRFLFTNVPLFKRNAYRLCAFQLSYLKRQRLFSVAGRVLPHARNIARAPFSVQEDLWPFAHAGTMEEMKAGDHIALGVAGLVISGRYQRLKEPENGSSPMKRNVSGAIRLSRHFHDGLDATNDATRHEPSNDHGESRQVKFNTGVSLGAPGAGQRRTGLPQVRSSKGHGASTFDSDVLAFPHITDGCRSAAEASDAYSNMLAAEHFHQQQLRAQRRRSQLRFHSDPYVPFRVLPAGEYECQEPGLIFAMGPTALRTPDPFARGAPNSHANAAQATEDRDDRGPDAAERHASLVSGDGVFSPRQSMSQMDIDASEGLLQTATATHPSIMVDDASSITSSSSRSSLTSALKRVRERYTPQDESQGSMEATREAADQQPRNEQLVNEPPQQQTQQPVAQTFPRKLRLSTIEESEHDLSQSKNSSKDAVWTPSTPEVEFSIV